ncbi:MAG: hypothetical protein M1142_05275 [Patescibacteria group bacterium]|nr:hypothetical protein [Patescibacteria group bacterium]
MPTVFEKPIPDEQNLPVPEEKHHVVSTEDSDPVKTHLSWIAPARPYRKKDRSYYTTIATLVILLILIALLAREILLIGVLLALGFVAYVLGFVPPEDIEYKISDQGVTIGNHFYFWGDLDSFWLSEKEGHGLMHIVTHYHFPAQLILVLGKDNEAEVKKEVAHYLPFHEIPPKSLIDSWAESLQKHFPLENPHR